MFVNIDLNDYDFQYHLHWSYFLRDCLHEEISFTFEDRPDKDTRIYPPPFVKKVIIYKKLDNDKLKEICLDELIFYIHTEVYKYHNQKASILENKIDIKQKYIQNKYKCIRKYGGGDDECMKFMEGEVKNINKQNAEYHKIIELYKRFNGLFGKTDFIKTAVKNMNIIFKYDKSCEFDEYLSKKKDARRKHYIKKKLLQKILNLKNNLNPSPKII